MTLPDATGGGTPASRRPPVPSDSSGPARTVGAVDIGGTRVRVALVDAADGRVLERVASRTPTADRAPSQIVETIRDFLLPHRPECIVVGAPGRVNHAEGVVEFARNLPVSWCEHLREDRLTSRLGVPVVLAGDAELAAIGECYAGAGSTAEDCGYLTLSTGVGAAAVCAGTLLTGRRSAFQIGNVPVGRLNGPVLDHLASGRSMSSVRGQDNCEVHDVQTLLGLAASGDTAAARAWDTIKEYAGLAAVMLGHIVNPDVIVIGGGLVHAGDALLQPVREALQAYGPQDRPAPTRVVAASLGDDAALSGAAFWQRATATMNVGTRTVRKKD